MNDDKVMASATNTSMSLRFMESARAIVSSSIAMLARPSVDVAAGLAADLHTLGGEAAMMNLPEVARLAWEGENAAMQLAGGSKEALVPCLRALRRLGYLLQQSSGSPVAPIQDGVTPASVCRLLIVDDSPISAAALAAVFEMQWYEVRVASSWQDANRYIVSFMPRVLVTDVHMPDINVAELCEFFRQSAGGRSVAVVLVSGRNENELRDRLDRIQADLFIPKMEGAARVVARVTSLVQGLVE